MRKSRQIAILLPDTLQSTGLQSLLTDYFYPVEISCFPSCDNLLSESSDNFDYYFMLPDSFVLNTEYFMPRRTKVVIVLEKGSFSGTASGYNCLNAGEPQETIIDQLQHIFSAEEKHAQMERSKELSSRETDVLQLIAKGHINKDIADELNISLNTVLTHRKNITAKLGIKTVSGLTYYAIMNGLVSSDHIS